MMNKLIEKASTLIEALPYIQQFRNEVVVVKFGGSAMEDPERIRLVLQDILFMECAGMRVVVVHGGGKAINARLEEMKIPVKFVNGLRYTCERTIGVVDDVLHNVINADLVRQLAEMGGKPVAVSGKRVLRAERITSKDKETGQELDLGFVGEVVAVDTEQIRWTLNQDKIPVIAPLGRDMNGCVYNINADMAACRIAGELQARKLVFLSDVPGILQNPKDEASLIPTIRRSAVNAMVSSGVISGGMIPKVKSAIDALDMGTRKVHMIDGRLPHSLLLEIFTEKGIGTEILPE
jgi:acetylglutamate kinase